MEATPLTPDDGDTVTTGARTTSQVLRVTLAGADAPVEVETANPDLVAWDLHRARNKWPSHDDAPMLWLTFVAWRAMRRLNLTAVTWDDFSTVHCLDVDVVRTDDVDPTRTAAPDA